MTHEESVTCSSCNQFVSMCSCGQQPIKTPRTDEVFNLELDKQLDGFIQKSRQLETELSAANAEVERLKLIAADRNEWQEVALKVSKQRDTLLANSKALAESIALLHVQEPGLEDWEQSNESLAAHNKLMEQLSPTAAGSGMGG